MDSSIDSDAGQETGEQDLPVDIKTLALDDGTLPQVGDQVDVQVTCTLRKSVDGTAFLTPVSINGQPMPEKQPTSTSDEDLMAAAQQHDNSMMGSY